MKINFAKLTPDDLVLLHSWLNKTHVRQWYDHEKSSTLEAVKKRYLPKIIGEKPTQCYLALLDGAAFGYLQTYRVIDWPDFNDYLGYDSQVASVDLFIGEPSFLGKGMGKAMLRQFLSKVVFTQEPITMCVIGPDPSNTRAIKTYNSVGFVHKRTIHIPSESQPTYLMELSKKDFISNLKNTTSTTNHKFEIQSSHEPNND